MRSCASPARGDRIAQPLPRGERHAGVNARRQAAGVMRAAVDREIAPRAHVVNGGNPLLRHVAHGRVQGTVVLHRSGIGNRATHQPFGVVLEHAGQLALRIADDGPTRHVARLTSDAGGAQRGGIRQAHVAIEPGDPHRMIRRDAVDPGALRQIAAPVLVVPVAAGDPAPLGQGRRERLDPRDELGRRLGIAQLDRGQPMPAGDEVHVCVDEAGHHHSPARIDDPRAGSRKLPDLGAGSDRRDPLAAHRDRIRPWPPFVPRPDASVDDGEGDGIGSRCGSGILCEGGHAVEDEEESEEAHWVGNRESRIGNRRPRSSRP